MNILTERAPKTVNIGGAEIPINSDFRVSIRFEQLIDEPIPDEEKILQALALYYPFPVTDISEAINKMLWFYAAEKMVKDQEQVGKGCKTYTLIPMTTNTYTQRFWINTA